MRKLDALVERCIFGLEERPHKYREGTTEWYNPKLIGYKSFVKHAPSPYRTNMEPAWRVVEKLQEMNRILMLSYHPIDKRWCADFELWDDGGEYLGQLRYAHASTAPEAICLAALRAVGVSEEEIGAAVGDVKTSGGTR